jgi:membrane-bound lytic murein transglycosylase B
LHLQRDPHSRPAAPVRALFTLIATALPAIACAQVPTKKLDLTRPEVQRFIDSMAGTHGFDRAALSGTLADAVIHPSIVESMNRPAERTMSWWEYRRRFLTEERIEAGLALWIEQQQALDRVSAESGVPAEYLLAITGVETYYGRMMGRHRVLDSLSTLAFEFPRRSEFFLKELEAYLLITREEKLDPRVPIGSYAGAMGAPQFMPSSVRRYAVDGDGDGHRDLWLDWPDVFASIASYFTGHGWRAGEPVLADALVDASNAQADDPASARVALNETVAGLRERGYRFDTTLSGSARAMLVPAPQQDGLQWRVGFQNFYVITRYNRSLLYAMAVNDLAQALGERHRQLTARPESRPADTLQPDPDLAPE